MREAALQPPASGSALHTFFEISRFHIIAIASAASLTFGWQLTGGWWPLAALACALDWFVVNLTNRVVDLAEDRANGIVGTDLVARRGRLLELGCFALLAGSVAAFIPFAPGLLLPRLAFHAIGLAYNYKLLPSPSGRTRFKELYFFKNFMSAVLFLLSTMAYPLAVAGGPVPWAALAVLMAFFLPLEITYEIFYDLRDVKGDLVLKVPTFPVVHGVAASHAIIRALLGLSAVALIAGWSLGAIAWKEFVMIAAVVQQALYFELRIRPGATARACIFITYLGAAQVFSYDVWVWLGLPTTL